MARKRSFGEGGITQRPGGTWQAQVRLPDGSRRSKTFTTKKEASAWLADTRIKASQGMLPSDERLTLGTYLDQWLATHGPTLRPLTFWNYTRLIRRHLQPSGTSPWPACVLTRSGAGTRSGVRPGWDRAPCATATTS